jgi:hypothetical protein
VPGPYRRSVSTGSIWRWSALRLLAGSPRQEAVMDFMAKTLARSRTHRFLWLAYLGAAAAVLVNSCLIDEAVFLRSRGWSQALHFLVRFWPLACSVVVLARRTGWPYAPFRGWVSLTRCSTRLTPWARIYRPSG